MAYLRLVDGFRFSVGVWGLEVAAPFPFADISSNSCPLKFAAFAEEPASATVDVVLRGGGSEFMEF